MDADRDLEEMRQLLLATRKREKAEAIQRESKRRRTTTTPDSPSSVEDEDEQKEANARAMFGFGGDWVFETLEDQMKRGDLSCASEEMIQQHETQQLTRSGRVRPAHPIITREMQLKVLRKMLMRDKDHVREIAAMAQRTPGWHAARTHRLTGSKAGTASANNDYESPDALLVSMLWPKELKPNAAMRNGTLMEPFAAKSFLRKIRCDMKDPNAQLAIPGLIVMESEPMLAYSPDGIVLFSDGTRRLIEIKTPFRRKPYPSVPQMYMCQMQLGMHLLDLESCYFVVYCGVGVEGDDSATHIQEIPRDRTFTENTMLPSLRKFFFRRYLPLVVCRDLGMLVEGKVHVPHGVRVEYLDESVWEKLNAERA